MPARTELGSLLFELAHPRRRIVLESLYRRPLRLSEIARISGTSPPEASRHLARLVSQGLIQRQSDGTFRPTGYGLLVGEGVASLEGLLPRRDFFRTHDLRPVPREFVGRLYELAGTETGSTYSDALRHTEQVVEEAEKFAWLMSDQVLLNTEVLLHGVRKSRATFRILIPTSILPPASRRVNPVPRDLPLELRALPEVRIGMALSERVAGVCFGDLSGSIDYARGFRGSSPGFRGWCEGLFDHFWKRGRPVRVW